MNVQERNQPFFSIIIPTYNRASFLFKTLKSILTQQFQNFEVIIVDDGSTDNTKDVLREMLDNDPRIKYFYKINEERSIARNYGISRAEGKYVGFLDSDDIFYSNHMTVGYEVLKRNNFPEVCHLGHEVISETGNLILVRNSFDKSFKEKLIHENIIHGNSIFVRTDILREVNFIPSRFAILSEDWYLWLRLAARYPFHFDNTVTSAIVQHNERSLMNIDPDKLIASTNIIVEYLKKDTPFLSEYKNTVSLHFANHYTFLTLILALTKARRRDTIKYLLKAIEYDAKVVLRRRFWASVKHLF
jgi:glycosyltransferase involved in cell wall biosynthesis